MATDPTSGKHLVLLPTPVVNDMGEGKTPPQFDAWTEEMRAKHGNGNGHGPSLAIEAQRAEDAESRFGEYGPAVERQESFTRPAPEPLQIGSKGQPQLAPRFTEWMQGLDEGWVTDPAIWKGMTDKRGKPASATAIRSAQLHALGNGVIPLQSAVALRILLIRAIQSGGPDSFLGDQ